MTTTTMTKPIMIEAIDKYFAQFEYVLAVS